MKLISFAVPCYNSAEYMDVCIESLLPGGDDVEILLVDDGSSDGTLAIAKDYESRYPGIVRAIHQENKGHGGAVNTGLSEATGVYFKVVDSDDWLDDEGYAHMLSVIKNNVAAGVSVDMYLSNYVYDNKTRDHHRRMVYTALFDTDRVIGWSDMKRHIKGFTILMHSVIYRTAMLREECKLVLPEHTFYVDNLFVYFPLPYVKKIYYLNETVYHYFIGRDGQSVAEQTMIKRIDQQFFVNYKMIDGVDLKSVKNKDLRKYMLYYLEMISCITTVLCYISGDQTNYRKARRLWVYLKKKDRWVYRRIRFGIFGGAVNIPTPAGRRFSRMIYKLSQRYMGFN